MLNILKHYIQQRRLSATNKTLDITPWCKDVIICNNHFTNISRRDDFVTRQIYLKLKHLVNLQLQDLIFNTVLYRLSSNRFTIGALPVYDVENFEYYNLLWDKNRIISQYGKFFSGRFMTLCNLEAVTKALIELLKIGIQLTSKEAFIKDIKKIKGIGNFFAWQICCDLVMFSVVPYDDKFYLLGPGAKAGLKLLGMDFVELSKVVNLNFEDLEHTLCEFFRYIRLLEKFNELF